jgi:hypothetical protein
MWTLIAYGLFLLGFVLPIGAVLDAPPSMAAVYEFRLTEEECLELGCGLGSPPECDSVCNDEPPDLEPSDPQDPTFPLEVCDDGRDNNGDGRRDCADLDCIFDPACPEICNNGTDDDGDGLSDCRDGRCQLASECAEICFNRFDDDGDGLIDCKDPYCQSSLLCSR